MSASPARQIGKGILHVGVTFTVGWLLWEDHKGRGYVNVKPRTLLEVTAKPLYPESMHWPYPGDVAERDAFLAKLRTIDPAFDRGRAGERERQQHLVDENWQRLRVQTIRYLLDQGLISNVAQVTRPLGVAPGGGGGGRGGGGGLGPR
eukprot:EC715416.1.p1 GENE.EC715416.1~~EC715416.1.p1  ORF type:complete len:161 (+),score=14.79 EC715416.1:40-483(+)